MINGLLYDRPQAQPRQYSPQEIFVPQVPMSYPQTQQFLGIMLLALVNDLAQGCGQHQARMFTWNQISLNNFQNADYTAAAATLVDYFELEVTKGNNPNMVAQNAPGMIASMLVSINISRYQQLQSVTPPQVVHQSMGNMQLFQQMSNEITARKRAMGTNVPMNSYQNNSMPMNMPAQMPMQMQQASYQNPNFQRGGFQQQPMNQPSNMGFVQSGFAANPMSGNFQTPAISEKQYFVPDTPAPQQMQQQNTQQQNNQTTMSSMVKLWGDSQTKVEQKQIEQPKETDPRGDYTLVTENDWKWSLEQPYKYGCSIWQKLEYRKYSNGVVRCHQIELKGEELERAKHVINKTIRSDGKTQWDHLVELAHKTDPITIVRMEDMAQANDITIASDNDNTIIVEDMTSEINRGIVKSMLVEDDQVYKTTVFKINPLFYTACQAEKEKLKEDLTALGLISNETGIAIVLKSMISDESPAICKRVAKELNVRLTQETNRVLQIAIGLKLSIESFVEDAPSLVTYVSSKFGVVISEGLQTVMKTVINKAIQLDKDNVLFNELDSDLMELFTDDMCATTLIDKYFCYFTKHQAHELSLSDLSDARVTDSINNSIILGLADTIRDDLMEYKQDDKRLHNVKLITSDGVIFTLTHGAIVKGSIMISKD